MLAEDKPENPQPGVQGNTVELQDYVESGEESASEIPHVEEPVRRKPMIKINLRVSKNLIKAVIAVAIVIVAIVGFNTVLGGSRGTSSTTTAQTIKVGAISACKGISGAGSYFLSANIKTRISSGACINITADNVALVCNQHSILGSGPYSGVPPFTYGVLINARNNVSVSGCTISNFSYGVYAQSSNRVRIDDNNLTRNYLSDAYLGGTRNSSLFNNIMSRSSSVQGAIYLANGSSNNKIYNNTLQGNRFYGISVESTGNRYINNTFADNPSSFYCGATSSFTGSSYAVGNSCRNNTGCAFVTCKGLNMPANISTIQLGSSINTCGSVISPGSYQLTSDLNTSMFVNTSNPIFKLSGTPCIAIAASNVRLDCNGHSIINAPIAVLADNSHNVTITNCALSNSGHGVELNNITGTEVSNVTFRNDTMALLLHNITSSVFSNFNSIGNRYGAYMTGALSDTFFGFNTSENQYGSIPEQVNRQPVRQGHRDQQFEDRHLCNTRFCQRQATT